MLCRACRLSVVTLAAALMSSGAPLGFAADEGKPTVEKIEYKGWKNNLRLSNGTAELIVTQGLAAGGTGCHLHATSETARPELSGRHRREAIEASGIIVPNAGLVRTRRHPPRQDGRAVRRRPALGVASGDVPGGSM